MAASKTNQSAKIRWFKTDYPGITYCEHSERKHGVKFDRYFRAQYQVGGKRKTIGFGWASEGWTPKEVFLRVNQYRHNAKTGEGPTTLKEEREQKEAQRRAEEEEERRVVREKITFADYFNTYYLPQAKTNKKARSVVQEEVFFRKWISPQFGEKPLKQISASDIERLKEIMLKADMAPRSVAYCLAVVRQIFNHASNLDIYEDRNPVSKVKMPRGNNTRTRFLTKAEADSLLKKLAEKSQQLHDIALMSLHCGLRAGEIFALTWDSIDFENGTIQVKDAKDARKGSKTRYAYMTKAVREMLERNKAESENPLVFPDKKGKQITSVSKAFPKAVEELGLNEGVEDPREKVCFHTLRHTFASWQVQAGMSLYELQRLLGHESFAMVQRYAHLAPENLKRATAIFDNQEDNKILNFPQQQAS